MLYYNDEDRASTIELANNFWDVPSQNDITNRIHTGIATVNWVPPLDNIITANSWSKDLVDWYLPESSNSNVLKKSSLSGQDSLTLLLLNNTVGPADGLYLSLGYTGFVTFDLGANTTIGDSTGDDIIVFETVVGDSLNPTEHESAIVLVSNQVDGPWELAAQINGTAGIDIGSLSESSYRYIKIQDASTGDTLALAPGFDLDAIKIRHRANPTTIEDRKPETIISEFSLLQNYPNPFNPSTTIEYALPEVQQVSIELFNLQGQKVQTIFTGKKERGVHQLTFEASGLASGVYLYRITAGKFSQVKKMILIR